MLWVSMVSVIGGGKGRCAALFPCWDRDDVNYFEEVTASHLELVVKMDVIL